MGVAASGNMAGLSEQAFAALPSKERAVLLAAASERLFAAGADRVIETVADLVPALEAEVARRAA